MGLFCKGYHVERIHKSYSKLLSIFKTQIFVNRLLKNFKAQLVSMLFLFFRMLLNNGVNVGAKTIKNETAEDFAEKGHDANCLKLLQQARKRECRYK